MYETSLDKVLNYMKQYVENRFEHDSEPMLNYKDLELVLNYIDKQKQVLVKIKEFNKSILKERWYGGNEKDYAKKNLEILEEIE
jgi:hypothetical protein